MGGDRCLLCTGQQPSLGGELGIQPWARDNPGPRRCRSKKTRLRLASCGRQPRSRSHGRVTKMRSVRPFKSRLCIWSAKAINGSLRFQSSVTPKTPFSQNEPEAVRPKQSGAQGTSRLGLDHKPTSSRLQPGLQPDDAWVLGCAAPVRRHAIGWHPQHRSRHLVIGEQTGAKRRPQRHRNARVGSGGFWRFT
jgi:hypothetical protein